MENHLRRTNLVLVIIVKKLFSYELLGDIVGLYMSKDCHQADNISGIVSKVTSSRIHLAFEESVDVTNLNTNARYHIIKLANDVTHKRLKRL